MKKVYIFDDIESYLKYCKKLQYDKDDIESRRENYEQCYKGSRIIHSCSGWCILSPVECNRVYDGVPCKSGCNYYDNEYVKVYMNRKSKLNRILK